VIIIDAGSGIRELGRHLNAKVGPVSCHLLLSHVHWDHIQGFPFFAPAFEPSTNLTVWSENNPERPAKQTLALQMSPPMFPISLTDMVATLDFRTFELGEEFSLGGARISTAPLNHPGGATAFRIDYAGHSYVHASDHEHTGDLYEPLVALANGADCLVYDAAYTDAEYTGRGVSEPRKGWGHSTWKEAIRTASAAEVEQLVLFQHQYDRTDDELDQIGRWAQKVRSNTLVAHEGMVLDLLDVD
jgi:phosphoribosyl 1,2-cyclic phosphodiesterase